MTATLADRARRYQEIVDANALEREALTALVAIDTFVQFGRNKSRTDWPATLRAIEARGPIATKIGRVDEAGPLVFLEGEERTGSGSLRTLTVFEFDAAGRICRIDCFQ